MPKSKPIIISLSVVIIILLVIMFYVFKHKEDSYNNVQDQIDKSFRYQLSEVAASFNRELKGEDNMGYDKCIASVAAASVLARLSSYDTDTHQLNVGLNYLYQAMLNDNTKEEVVNNTESFRELFNKLLMDPTDIQTTNELITFIGSLKK